MYPSQVGFDGKNLYFTVGSKFAFETGYNVVDLTRASHTFERRLEKYRTRGFDILFPGTTNTEREKCQSFRLGKFEIGEKLFCVHTGSNNEEEYDSAAFDHQPASLATNIRYLLGNFDNFVLNQNGKYQHIGHEETIKNLLETQAKRNPPDHRLFLNFDMDMLLHGRQVVRDYCFSLIENTIKFVLGRFFFLFSNRK